MAETPAELYARALAAADDEGRAPGSLDGGLENLPFDGPFRIRPLLPPEPSEPPRQGVDQGDCRCCARALEETIWHDDRWTLVALEKPSGLPVIVLLEPRAHLDLDDLDDEFAADLGRLLVRTERAVRSVPGVARVHVGKWGEGSAHLHWWFLARPFGFAQLRSSFAELWDSVLPPLPEPVWRANLAIVAEAMRAGG